MLSFPVVTMSEQRLADLELKLADLGQKVANFEERMALLESVAQPIFKSSLASQRGMRLSFLKSSLPRELSFPPVSKFD
jgi:hypothetical protein